MNLNAPQPLPTNGEGAEVWPLIFNSTALVIPDWLRASMRERHAIGVQKYGTGLQVWNGRDPVVDAFQEAMDLVVYARQARERLQAMKKVEFNAAMTLDIAIHYGLTLAERLGNVARAGVVPSSLAGLKR